MPPKEVARRQKLCSRAMRHLQYAHDKLMALRDQGLALPPEKQQLGKFEFFFSAWLMQIFQHQSDLLSTPKTASGTTFSRSIQNFPAFQRSYRMDRDQWISCGFPAMMMWETTRLRDLHGLNLYMPWRKPCVVERPLVWKLLLNKEMLCSWMSWTLKVVKWKQIGACGMQDVVPWNRISDSQLKSSLNDPTQRIYRKHVIATPMEFVQLQVVALGFKPLRGYEVRPWGKRGVPTKKTWLTPSRYSWKLPKKGRWVGVSWCILLPLAAQRCAVFLLDFSPPNCKDCVLTTCQLLHQRLKLHTIDINLHHGYISVTKKRGSFFPQVPQALAGLRSWPLPLWLGENYRWEDLQGCMYLGEMDGERSWGMPVDCWTMGQELNCIKVKRWLVFHFYGICGSNW